MTRLTTLLVLVLALGLGAGAAVAGGGKPSPTTKPTKKKATGYKVEVVTVTEQPILAKRATVAEAEVADTLQSLIVSLYLYATTQEIPLAGPPIARIHPPAADGTITVEAAVPTVKPAKGTAEIVADALPAGEAATVLHVGRHEDLPKAHRALERWLAKQGREAAGPMWQVFLTTPVTQNDPTKHRTKVFVPLRPAAK